MFWSPDFQDLTDDADERGLENQEGLDALDALEDMPEPTEQSEWVDRGIQPVSVRDLPEPEGIHDEDDFVKVSVDEMQAGLERLQEMQPAIESGEGASSDYWAQFDRERGLDYAHGYRRIYDAFYGQDAIRLVKDGDRYDIVNGRHRIWLAKRMGITTLPARLTERLPR